MRDVTITYSTGTVEYAKLDADELVFVDGEQSLLDFIHEGTDGHAVTIFIGAEVA